MKRVFFYMVPLLICLFLIGCSGTEQVSDYAMNETDKTEDNIIEESLISIAPEIDPTETKSTNESDLSITIPEVADNAELLSVSFYVKGYDNRKELVCDNYNIFKTNNNFTIVLLSVKNNDIAEKTLLFSQVYDEMIGNPVLLYLNDDSFNVYQFHYEASSALINVFKVDNPDEHILAFEENMIPGVEYLIPLVYETPESLIENNDCSLLIHSFIDDQIINSIRLAIY